MFVQIKYKYIFLYHKYLLFKIIINKKLLIEIFFYVLIYQKSIFIYKIYKYIYIIYIILSRVLIKGQKLNYFLHHNL